MSSPRPSFSTEEEILAGGQALADAEDTTTSRVEEAIDLGDPILDNGLVHARLLRKPDALLYHLFRGEEVPAKFWGTGEFGLAVLSVAEAYWLMDKPKVEFLAETCRSEVYGDNPREAPKYPDHFYGAYLVVVEGIDRKLSLSEDRIKGMAFEIVEELIKRLASWSNGN